MTRTSVIQALMQCLQGMGPAWGQAAQAAVVRRGIHLAWQENEMPALCLYNQAVQSVDLGAGSSERTLELRLLGAAPATDGDYAALDSLAASCIAALADPELNPCWERTTCGEMEIYEGGAADPVGLFNLEIRVVYETGPGEL